MGYNELDGRIPKGDQYAGNFTILVRSHFETKLLDGWGPPREIFTTSCPASYATLNSIMDNPAHGDERSFVQIKNANEGSHTYANTITVEPGQVYKIFSYYINSAVRSSVLDKANFAKGVRLRAKIPALLRGNNKAQAVIILSSENTKPKEVWNSIVLANDTDGDIALRYVPGSAIIHNFGNTNGSPLDGRALVTAEGVLLGYDELDGTIPSDAPGEKSFGGYVTFKIVADQANFEIITRYRNTVADSWTETIRVKAGETTWCMIEYKNTGTTQQNDVVLKARLPAGVHYVEGSGHMRNSNNPNPVSTTDNVVGVGINVGNYAPNANVLFWFQVKIDLDVIEQNGTRHLVNITRVETDNGFKENKT